MLFQSINGYTNKSLTEDVTDLEGRTVSLETDNSVGSDLFNEFIILNAARLIQTQMIYAKQLKAGGLWR